MRKMYKYRLKPTKAQKRQLEQTLELCRWVYNETLATRKNTYEQDGVSLSHKDVQNLLPSWKTQKPELKQAHSLVLQNAQIRVDLAFKAFFRRVKAGEELGYPRFKGYGRYDSLTYPQYGNGFILSKNSLSLAKIGEVKVVLHRPVEGTIKTVTIQRNSRGKWYACFSVEVSEHPLPQTSKVIGLDMGLTHFATTSEDQRIENPRFFRQDEQALKRAQRRMDRHAKGTPERAKARQVVSRIHERIANRRNNFAHQESRKLVKCYDMIALEKLTVRDLMDGNYRSLNKSIGDAAWTQFRTYVTYKAAEAGRELVEVDPRNTTKCCSRCGLLVEKKLSDRVHCCPHCGLTIDRDFNAALNILALGLQSVGSDP